MRLLALLMIVPLVGAGAGHDATPVPSLMYVHVGPELALHPLEPAGQVLVDAPDMTPCEGPLTWSAPFTRTPIDYEGGMTVSTAPELGRAASFGKAAPLLRWFVEVVGPDGPMEGLPLPPFGLEAHIDGEASYAAGTADQATAQEIVGRSVYRIDVSMPWTERNITGPFGLEMEMALDLPCRMAPPVRAYSDPDHRPRISWDVFDPVRLELLEAQVVGDDVHVRVHATSPWGPADLAMAPPTVTGPDGSALEPVLVADTGSLGIQREWAFPAQSSGTYRIDALVTHTTGQTDGDHVLMRIGGDPQPATQPAPEKESPGLPMMFLLVALALARRRA